MDSYYFSLLKNFTLTDFKLKYHNSLLGYLWSLLNPLLTFAVLYVVFSYFVRFEMQHYHLFLFLGIILWGFFNEGTLNAIASLYSKAAIMKKIYFPRTVVVAASVMTTFLGLILNFVVFLFFYLISGLLPSILSLLSILFLLNLFFITLGVAYIVAALNLRFSDIQHIWRILLQLFFWVTPIVYPLTLIPEHFRFLVYLNPFAALIEGIRELFLLNHFNVFNYITALAFAFVIFSVGLFCYKKMSIWFAEWV